MAQIVRTCLLAALFYGGFAATLIYGVTPWLHHEGWLLLHEDMSMALYQKRAVGFAALGYPLICGLLALSAYSRHRAQISDSRPIRYGR